YGLAGDFARAIALSAEADEISRRTGNLWGQSYSRLSLGPLYMGRGEFGRAIEVMEECIRLGEQAGFMVPLVQTRLFMAKAYADLGDTERAFELAALARPLVEQYFPAWKPSYFGMIAHMRLVEGNVAAAQAMIVEGFGGAEPEFHPFANGVLYFADAEVAVAVGDYERAVSLGERLVAPLRAYGIRFLALDPLYSQGRALLVLGRADEGRAALEDVRTEAEEMGARWHLWRILFTLSLIEAQAGNEAAAGVLHDQAREIIGYIADHTGSAALRASFLALPEVRAVLDDDSI
ncbi:MAG TPA: hypothetical protein VER55_16665, partial [Ardenticatenaceae bacterium]|nr:hypothetical protein [Ardenticatenaceae bacterium]